MMNAIQTLTPYYLLFFCILLFGQTFQVENLTLDQKIGQLFMVAAVADEEIANECMATKPYRMDKEYIEYLITNYHIGGIIYLGKSDPNKQIKRTQHFQNLSTIPLLIGQDLEPGRIGAARFDFWPYPNPYCLGVKNNLHTTYSAGYDIGCFCAQLGVHINFAPVVDIYSNPNNPVINNRSFGATPELVTQHALSFAQGLRHSGTLACVKHFPGHGDTTIDSHYSLPVLSHSRIQLETVELAPFKSLINAGIPAVMIGHLVLPTLEREKNLPATLSKAIVTDLLQEQLQFKGLVITDALDMKAITQNYSGGQAELLALLAGNDILLCPVDVPLAAQAIKQAITNGILSENALDKHAEKMLAIKQIIFIHIQKG